MFKIENLELQVVEGKLPFLYSSSKEIKIEENQKIYNIEFKIDSYHEEPLFISVDETFAHLEKCTKGEANILKCEITKENLDIIANKENSYDVYFIHEKLGYHSFPFIQPIKIIYPNIEKEDIHFSIVKLMNNQTEPGSYITFETNVVNMKKEKFKTKSFTLIWNTTEYREMNCHFIKHDKSTPLYLSCEYGYKTDYIIEQIEGFNQSDLHYYYNFDFETQNFTETIFSADSLSSRIIYAYPEVLDFTNKDNLELYVFTELDNITLNQDEGYLECQSINLIKNCKVTKSHFKNKGDGYYLFYHRMKNDGEKNVADYEAFGVNVILEKKDDTSDSNEFITLSFYWLALLSFFIIL